MDEGASSARNLLLEAREALDEHDYDRCVQLCRDVLALDGATDEQRKIAEKRVREARPSPGRHVHGYQRYLHHVTPLFLLADILQHGGLRCGADTALKGLPRRVSSRDEDDTALTGERCNIRLHEPIVPSRCVLLYRVLEGADPLISDKLRTRAGTPSKGYPHCVLRFASEACLRASQRTVFGAEQNVGRTLRAGNAVTLRPVRFVADLVKPLQEIMIRADGLADRTLPIGACDQIRVFSAGDAELVKTMLEHRGLAEQIRIETHPLEDYLSARQSQVLCQRCVTWTEEYCDAMLRDDVLAAKKLRQKLGICCFDKPPKDPKECSEDI